MPPDDPSGPDTDEMAADLRRRLAGSPWVELRAVPQGGGGRTMAHWVGPGGRFPEVAAAHWAAEQNRAGLNVYATFNRIDARPTRSAADAHVAGRTRLFLDIDPVRPANVAATADQRAAAAGVADAVAADLAAAGWGDPAERHDTGNGQALYYLCEPGLTTDAVKAVLKALAARHDTPAARIDPAVCNPARISRLAGSVNTKGGGRQPCRVLAVCPDPVTVTAEMAAEVAAGAASPHPDRPMWADPPAAGKPGDTPGADFNRRADWWTDILDPAGAKPAGSSGDVRRYTRPGKDGGVSATVGHYRAGDGSEALHVFTANWPGLVANKTYDKFGAFTRLFHGGDFKAAAKSLRAKGYGSEPPRPAGRGSRPKAAAEPTAPAGPADDDGLPPVRERADDPHRLARVVLAADDAGGPARLWHWRCEWWRWADGRYRPLDDVEVKAAATRAVKAEADRLAREAAALAPPGEPPPACLRVTVPLVNNVLNAMRGERMLSADADAPFWVGDAAGPPAAELVAFPNGLLHLPAFARGCGSALVPPSPRFFNTAALGFAFAPAAPPPAAWLAFLGQLWPSERESVDALQEWFGYCLTPDTSLQKLLLVAGPPRSGKGTILRVMGEMVGDGLTSTTLASLGDRFGLAPLVGKTLALLPDSSLTNRADAAAAVERIKSVVGEDVQDIDRKNRPAVSGRLRVRFAVATNAVPKLPDPGGAFAARLLALRIIPSFKGREDVGLEARLLAELSGVFRWAVAGWHRLRDRGRFVQPASGVVLVRMAADLSDTVGAFLRERCLTGRNEIVAAADLFTAYGQWCQEAGVKSVGTKQQFGKDLLAAFPTLCEFKPWNGGGARTLHYKGLRLIQPGDPDPDPDDAQSAQSADAINSLDTSKTQEDIRGEDVEGELEQSADCADCASGFGDAWEGDP